MKKFKNKVIYNKISSQGKGPVPLGAEGKVLKYVEHPVTVKLLVDFSPHCIAIVPLSSVKFKENCDD